MNMKFKTLLVGTTMLMMTASAAFAEVVLNRGSAADPESLDPHKTSTTYEADILRDMFAGLMKMQRQPSFPAPPKASPRQPMARRTHSSFAPTASGPMARPSPPPTSSFHGSASSILKPLPNMPICWLPW
jgi:hypothetical protein